MYSSIVFCFYFSIHVSYKKEKNSEYTKCNYSRGVRNIKVSKHLIVDRRGKQEQYCFWQLKNELVKVFVHFKYVKSLFNNKRKGHEASAFTLRNVLWRSNIEKKNPCCGISLESLIILLFNSGFYYLFVENIDSIDAQLLNVEISTFFLDKAFQSRMQTYFYLTLS